MNCQYYDNNFETCTNGDCPFCSDFCPVTENQEVCRYSELDDTETVLRRCLDAEKEDSREAIQALAEENRDLKKQLEKVKAERDAAVEKLTLAVNQYRMETTGISLCGLRECALPPEEVFLMALAARRKRTEC